MIDPGEPISDQAMQHFRDAVSNLDKGGSYECRLNITTWLGERAKYLIAEIDRLKAEPHKAD